MWQSDKNFLAAALKLVKQAKNVEKKREKFHCKRAAELIDFVFFLLSAGSTKCSFTINELHKNNNNK